MVTLDGGERRVWLHADHPRRIAGVVAYRGGYLASVYGLRQMQTGGAVFDAQGKVVRKLGGCLTGPVNSPDSSQVAWATCSSQRWTLIVGPRRDVPAPDREQTLPDTRGTVPYPAAVDGGGVTVQRADPIRGYARGAFVVDASTGDVRRLPDVSQVKSVSPRGIACVQLEEQGTYALMDLRTGALVRRLSRPINAWSVDGGRGLVERQNNSWDVVNARTGELLRHVELPAGAFATTARWEGSHSLLFVVHLHAWTTIIRVTRSGAFERISTVMPGADTPNFL